MRSHMQKEDIVTWVNIHPITRHAPECVHLFLFIFRKTETTRTRLRERQQARECSLTFVVLYYIRILLGSFCSLKNSIKLETV